LIGRDTLTHRSTMATRRESRRDHDTTLKSQRNAKKDEKE
jgi:hypothetical protein